MKRSIRLDTVSRAIGLAAITMIAGITTFRYATGSLDATSALVAPLTALAVGLVLVQFLPARVADRGRNVEAMNSLLDDLRADQAHVNALIARIDSASDSENAPEAGSPDTHNTMSEAETTPEDTSALKARKRAARSRQKLTSKKMSGGADTVYAKRDGNVGSVGKARIIENGGRSKEKLPHRANPQMKITGKPRR